jgi:hypothetical protein
MLSLRERISRAAAVVRRAKQTSLRSWRDEVLSKLLRLDRGEITCNQNELPFKAVAAHDLIRPYLRNRHCSGRSLGVLMRNGGDM